MGMYEITRSEDEINDVLNKASEQIDSGTKWPGMSYEEGVRNAIYWLTGFDDEHPMDE